MMLELQGPAGSLEALLDEPADQARAAVVFAHPHPLDGGTMHTKVVFQGAKALARIGCAVLRFNFRGVGRSEGTFDGGPGETGDFRAALDFLADRYPGAPLWAAGFSFGSWVALEHGSLDPRVALLLGISPPVGDGRYPFPATRQSVKPKFFIQGEADEIAPLEAMWKFYGELPEPKELVVIDAADHLFDGRVSEVADAIEGLLQDYDDGRADVGGVPRN